MISDYRVQRARFFLYRERWGSNPNANQSINHLPNVLTRKLWNIYSRLSLSVADCQLFCIDTVLFVFAYGRETCLHT